MKKCIKYFSMILMFALFMFAFSFVKTKAEGIYGAFDTNKNKVGLSVSTEGESGNKEIILHISVTFTRGFDQSTAKYYICKNSSVNTLEECNESDKVKWDVQYAVVGNISGSADTYSNEKSGVEADKNPTTRKYTVHTGVTFTSQELDTEYKVFVQTIFCARRSLDENGHYQSGNGCLYFHNEDGKASFVSQSFKANDIVNITITEIGDEELDSMMDKIVNIVMKIVIPIIYTVLGLFLVVKGSLLGIQIVKAADEPQVRQEKVGALKWLVIGIAVAYAATGLVQTVTAILSGQLNFN